jgi:hypothetical protein
VEITKKQWQWDDEFPNHLRTLGNAMFQIDNFRRGHVETLAANAPDPRSFTDEPTAFHNAAVVYLVASWEAFIEDLALAAVSSLFQNTDDCTTIPKSIKKLTVRAIEKDKNELAAWNLAGDGWKLYAFEQVRLRVESLNTPKSTNIDALYSEVFGVRITDCWQWEYISDGVGTVEFDIANTVGFIDGCVSLRNAIAHGRAPERQPCPNFHFDNVLVRMFKVSFLMSNFMSSHIEEITGREPWRKVYFQPDWRPFLVPA